MDRRQDGTAAAISGACPVPAGGEAIAPRAGCAAEGCAARPVAALVRRPPSVLRTRTATRSAARDAGSALRRRRTFDPAPSRPAARRGRLLLNAVTEILR